MEWSVRAEPPIWRKIPSVPPLPGRTGVVEPLVELETDKVTVEVPSPADGSLESISVQEGDTVQVGALLGAIAEGAKGVPSATPAKNPQAAAPKPAAQAPAPPMPPLPSSRMS